MTKQTDFIDKIKAGAIDSEYRHGVPAPVTMAQAILESGWGSSELATKANAYFGVKYSTSWPLADNPYVTGKYKKSTTEYRNDGTPYQTTADFCSYRTLDDSLRDHGLFMNRDRYLPALDNYRRSNDYDRYARDIKAAGYATTPGYEDKLIQLMDQYELRQYKPGQQNLTPLLDKIADLEAHNAELSKQLNVLDSYARRKFAVYDAFVRDLASEVSRG